jgi:hypothetical protein
LYSFNDGGETAVQVYQALGERLLSNLSQRQQTLMEMPFQDVLIDVDVADIVDLVRVYSTYSKP